LIGERWVEIAMGKTEERQASIRNITEVPRDELPGHFGGALSKLLVHPRDHRLPIRSPHFNISPQGLCRAAYP
jgi:hypothetical protein